MTSPRGSLSLSLIGALALLLALLSPLAVTTAQAPLPGRSVPPQAVDVFVQVEGVEYQCYPVLHAPTEAIPSGEVTATFAAPPTFTPAIWASPTPDHIPPTPTLRPILCAGVVRVEEGYSLRVRSTPNGGVIGALQHGTGIDVLEQSDDGRWFRIEDPLPGWIAGEWVVCS